MLSALTVRGRVRRAGAGFLFDVAISVAALGGTLAVVAHGLGGSSTGSRHLDLLGVVLAACSALPLLAWRRHPVGVFVAATAASAVLMLLNYPGGPPFGGTIALYLLASRRDLRRVWTWRTTVTVVVLFTAHISADAIGHGTVPASEIAIGALVWAVAWFAGDRSRLRRAEIAELEQRAVRAERDAERERRLATAEERGRIARDLHDSAGHAINVIAVQAGAARLWHATDPDRSLAALKTIEQVARDTVGEIDQIVHSLREEHTTGRVETPAGLAGIDTLISQHVGSGLTVSMTRRGEPRALPSAIDLAAYRILQEALTNAARHGAGQVEIEVAFEEQALELLVRNPARAVDLDHTDGGGGGHGLIGMRERATILGGEVQAGRLNGHFVVRARFPEGAVDG